MRIAFVSTYDSSDINNWSGTPFYISKTVQKYIGNVDYIGNIDIKSFLINNFKNFYLKKVKKKVFLAERSKKLAEHYANQVNEKLIGNKYDFIISIGVIPIAFLKTDIPIITIADANFHSMIDYYFKNLSDLSIKDGNQMESRGLNKSKLVVFASDWAANSAIDFYKIEKNKVCVIPFGANLDIIPPKENLKKVIKKPLELLFMGKEWERKGGDIVVETFYLLNNIGIETNLTIVGLNPPLSVPDTRIKIYPFINKSKEKDRNLMSSILFNTDIFFMPSRAECYGIVFCESNAYGIPCIAADTGGISTIIKNGTNGYLLNPSAKANEYCELIKTIISDEKSFLKLRENSRKRYEDLLNWDSFGKELKSRIDAIIP